MQRDSSGEKKGWLQELGVTDSEECKARAQYKTTSKEEDEKNKGAPHVRVLLPSPAVPVTGRPPPHQLTPMTHHPAARATPSYHSIYAAASACATGGVVVTRNRELA